MAKSVQITTRENAAKIVVDGNEISDVIAYTLEETAKGVAMLKLEIAITGEVEVRK